MNVCLITTLLINTDGEGEVVHAAVFGALVHADNPTPASACSRGKTDTRVGVCMIKFTTEGIFTCVQIFTQPGLRDPHGLTLSGLC